MSIFRESFPDFIKNQISLRQDLISGDVRNLAMRHLNSRSPWIRMSSSVNVNGSSDLAKANVLFNGTSSNTKVGEYKMNEGFGDDKGTYKKGPLGFRPMSGIDNISIKNRGAYGSLREVTVNFKCWDINQLEDLEVLYMRPGYTVLIEWGWSNYLSKDSKGNTSLKQADEYYDILNMAQPKTISEITKELREKIEKSQGNYDAMFGKIKNYSWSARTDGGYDCTATIISIGEIIESLKLNNTDLSFDALSAAAGGTVVPASYLTGYQEGSKLAYSYDKNFLAGVLNELYAYGVTQMTNSSEGESRTLTISNWENNPTLQFFAIDNPGGVPELSDDDKKKSILQGNKQVYITLESLCEVLNNAVLPRFNSPLKISTKTKNNKGDIQDNLCIWNPLQVSVDPSICIISSPVWEVGVNFKSIVSESDKDLEKIKKAEKSTGIGVPEKAAEAESVVNSVLVHMLDNQGGLSGIDETNKVIKPIVGFISKGTSVEDKQKHLDQLQIAYENLRGEKKLLTEIFPQIIGTNGTPNIVGKLDEGENKTSTYWTFSKLKGQSSAPKQSGILIVKTGAYDGGSYQYVDTVNDDKITYFKSTSNINFVEMLGQLDSNDAKNYVDKIKKAVGKGSGYPSGSDLTKQDDLINAQQAAANAINATQSNKSFIKYLEKLNKKFHTPDEKGIIGNIYININYLYKRIVADISNTDRQEKNEISLYDFIKGTLKDVQASIGNLNNFEIYVNDEHASIIDINFSGNLSVAKEAFEVQVQNKRSIVRNYTLQSQIFPEQSSMISIAAQADNDLLNTDSASLKAYSKNITDRTLKVPTNDTAKSYLNDVGNKYSTINRVLSKIAEFFASTPIKDNATSPTTTVSSGNEYKNALRDLIQFSRQHFAVPGNNFNVIIPTKLSLTFDGLGGVVIGNLFKISPNALPKGYKGDGYGNQLGYIVTDISQDVKSGDWTTTIGAQTIVLDSPGSDLVVWDYNKLVVDIDPNTLVNEGAVKVMLNIKASQAIKDTLIPALNATSLSNNMKLLLTAHSIAEGYFPGSRGYRNNNPGNLDMSPIYKKWGAVLEDDPGKGKARFAKFPSLQKYFEAKENYVTRAATGQHSAYPKNATLLQYIQTYAPSGDGGNNPTAYTNTIVSYFAANGVKISADSKLADIIK